MRLRTCNEIIIQYGMLAIHRFILGKAIHRCQSVICIGSHGLCEHVALLSCVCACVWWGGGGSALAYIYICTPTLGIYLSGAESASRPLCGFWMVDDQQLGN
jgi:hypothetical protein